MSQNLATMHPDAQQWAAVDNALEAIEQALLPSTVKLSPDERKRLPKMGDGSEAFCRKALDVMSQNTGILPRDFDVVEMRRDLEAHDAFGVRMVRLSRLLERVRDTELALGSDVMVSALEGYAFLKIAGKGEGLNGLRRELGRRFDGQGKRPQAPLPSPKAVPIT